MSKNLSDLIKELSSLIDELESSINESDNDRNEKEDGVYRAIDIAKYIINKSIDNAHPVSNLKLQKLLYYVQAASLVEQGKEMFQDELIAWMYGPVAEDVYDEYKFNSRYNITEKEDIAVKIDDKSKALIDKVLEKKSDFSAYELANKTHEELPWKSTNQGDIIKKELIKEYFCENKDVLWEKKK